MGNWYSARILKEYPEEHQPPSYPPDHGFPEGREERVMKVSNEELSAMKVPFEKRDYCAHIWVEYLKCRRDNFPFMAKCSTLHHDWDHCEFEDHILRMKEYERERRLVERAKRRSTTEAAEAM